MNDWPSNVRSFGELTDDQLLALLRGFVSGAMLWVERLESILLYAFRDIFGSVSQSEWGGLVNSTMEIVRSDFHEHEDDSVKEVRDWLGKRVGCAVEWRSSRMLIYLREMRRFPRGAGWSEKHPPDEFCAYEGKFAEWAFEVVRRSVIAQAASEAGAAFGTKARPAWQAWYWKLKRNGFINDDADALIDDVLLRVRRASRRFDEARCAGDPTRWLYGLAVNASKDALRREIREEAKRRRADAKGKGPQDTDEPEPPGPHGPETIYPPKRLIQRVEDALADRTIFSELDEYVFKQRIWERRSYEEIVRGASREPVAREVRGGELKPEYARQIVLRVRRQLTDMFWDERNGSAGRNRK